MSPWTWFYLALGASFALTGQLSEPALMAAAFWVVLAVANEAVDRLA